MTSINEIISLLEKLEEKKVYYRLNKTRADTIMIEVAIPGQRWEIEYNTYGKSSKCQIEIEKFISDGIMYDDSELELLFRDSSE